MSTVIRPEISERSAFYISKHRYYELKHFCLQYPEWREKLKQIDGLIVNLDRFAAGAKGGGYSDPTALYAEARVFLSQRMEMVDRAAEKACGYLAKAMIESVTHGISYEKMAARGLVCCGKEAWYAAYRKFFWLLDKSRK